DGRKYSIFVETLPPFAGPPWKWPLLRASSLQHFIRESADIEIAIARRRSMLEKYFFRLAIRKQRRFRTATQSRFQTPCKVDGDAPIVAGFSRGGHRRPDPRDATFRVGYGPVFFPPGGRR